MIRLPVPPLADQLQTVRSAAHLTSMEATVARLRDDLWRHPQNASRVLAGSKPARLRSVRRWLDTLPYPLASILQRFSAMRDQKERLEALLGAFLRGVAQFSCAVLLSVLRADSELLSVVRPDIVRVAGRQGNRFNRAEFGLWTKSRPSACASDRPYEWGAGEAGASPGSCRTGCWAHGKLPHASPFGKVLNQARGTRNARAHSGVTPPAEVESSGCHPRGAAKVRPKQQWGRVRRYRAGSRRPRSPQARRPYLFAGATTSWAKRYLRRI